MLHFFQLPNSFSESHCLCKYIFLSVFLLPSVFWAHKITVCLCPSLIRHPSSPRVCIGHLLQRRLKAFLCLPCHHGLFNNYPNKVNDKWPPYPSYFFFYVGPQLSSSGLMNGAIGHASCPGGEQAAPAGQPGHRARGRKWSSVEEGQGRAGMPELTPGKAWTERTSGNMEKRREGQ